MKKTTLKKKAKKDKRGNGGKIMANIKLQLQLQKGIKENIHNHSKYTKKWVVRLD